MKHIMTKLALSTAATLALAAHVAHAQEPVWDGNKVVLESE
jgi:hypothetical protein